MGEVTRPVRTVLPSSPTIAARNLAELTAVSATSAPCCQQCFEKQMSACFSWVLWLYTTRPTASRTGASRYES